MTKMGPIFIELYISAFSALFEKLSILRETERLTSFIWTHIFYCKTLLNQIIKCNGFR